MVSITSLIIAADEPNSLYMHGEGKKAESDVCVLFHLRLQAFLQVKAMLILA